MANRKKKIEPAVLKKTKRTHRQTLMFNDTEMGVITNFCRKYKITKKTKFFREAIISAILQKMEEDYPTLF
ncbi:MAG: hypothetical protein LBP85_09830 [Prevotellaceae bacterium]|jgi:diacylglycerol kinase family enzyme|nr:hypothetical protein [Prevotellaceae bacterium]